MDVAIKTKDEKVERTVQPVTEHEFLEMRLILEK